MHRRLNLAAVILLSLCGFARSQAPATPAASAPVNVASSPPPTSFEVASIRMVEPHPVADLQRGIGVFSMSPFPTARFFMHNTTLTLLISRAYEIGSQILNVPDWATSQLYDVDATVDDEKLLTREEIQPLLQELLAQRFHLKVHRETHTSSGYELVVAKGGPKLLPAKEGARPKDMPSAFHAQLLPDRFDGWDISVQTLAHILAGPAGRSVIDNTAITGSYDIQLSYASGNDPNSALPDFFTAIQEQLGLKLEPAKVPVDYLVIDHVDRVPTEN